MKDIKRCTRCILPESIPSVKLDKNGVCNCCKTYHRLFSNWENVKSQRQKEFEALVQGVKRLNRSYDCLVPLSGGKDSTYALYLCDKIYKLKCLCVTFDNGFLSEQAKTNIKNALKATSADHIFYSINRNVLLSLYKLFLVECGYFCPACMRGIGLSAQMVLKRFRIPLAVWGTGRRISYLSPISELFQGDDVNFFKNVIKGKPLKKNVGPMLLNPSRWNIQKIIRLSFSLLRLPNLTMRQHIGLYDYIDASYDKIYNTLKREMGWEKGQSQFEHMDCLLHEIPFYIHTLRFPELTTVTVYHSHLIRLGLMAREKAMNIERNKLVNPQEPQALGSFLREIGMSKDKFQSSVRDWRRMAKLRNKKRNALVSLCRRIGRV